MPRPPWCRAPEGTLHDHRCRNEGRRSHQEQTGQGDTEERKRCHEQRLGAGEPPLGRRDNLHIAGVGIDALQTGGRLARIVLEQLPAEPCLANLVETAADRGEFGRHDALAERVSLLVADLKPEIGRFTTQLLQFGRLAQHQAALRVARDRALHDVDHAIFIPLGQREAGCAQPGEDDRNQRNQNGGLEREEAPAEPRAQAIGIVVLAHGSFFRR